MGTSGAYGGSGAADWVQAHDLYQAVGQGAAPGPGTVDDLVAALVSALRCVDRPAGQQPSSYAPASLRPGRASAGDGYARSRTAGPTGGATSGTGRRAARGATALAGAQAYRAGDRQALADLGLDLRALTALPSDRARCVAIADALLGIPAHPEEVALKAAAIQTMAEALKSKEQMNPELLVERFVGNLTYEQVMVELTSQQRAEALGAKQAATVEKKIKKYIASSLRAGRAKAALGRLGVQAMVEHTAALAAKVLRIYGRTP